MNSKGWGNKGTTSPRYVTKNSREEKSQTKKNDPPTTNSKPPEKYLFQSGTGPHFDINPHCLWRKQLVTIPTGNSDYGPLDRWRPFQSQIPLKDQIENDSSLEVIPGIHLFAERYYQLGQPGEGLAIPPRHYSCHLKRDLNHDLITLFIYVKRIPDNWDPTKLTDLPSMDQIATMDRPEIVKHITALKNEIRKFEKVADYPKAGDFIIWDMRLAHQNGAENRSKQVRQTFYHAYLPAGPLNEETVNGIRINREIGKHPDDFPKSHALIEKSNRRCDLNDLGNLLYNYNSWTNTTTVTNNVPSFQLTDIQISFFRRYGYVVIPNCIPLPLINSLNQEISECFLNIAGIDTKNLIQSTKAQWKKMGRSFGGIIELYYCPSQDEIRQHPNPYWVIVQLLEHTWFHQQYRELGFANPYYGELNPRHLWLYCDRMNYRLPEDVLKKISEQ